jgi:hypothetical protein
MEAIIEIKNENILGDFLKKKQENTTEGRLERIHAETKIENLFWYHFQCRHIDYPLEYQASCKKIDELGDILISETDGDQSKLAQLYLEYSYHLNPDTGFGKKIMDKMYELYAPLITVEEVLKLQEGLPNRRWMSDSNSLNICTPAEKRICEIVATDERRFSFPYLIKIWKPMRHELSNQEEIAKFMPAALALEKDFSTILSYLTHDYVYTQYNHYENAAHGHVWQRINKMIKERILSETKIKNLEWYREMTNSRELISLADERLAEIASGKLAWVESLFEVIDYYREFSRGADYSHTYKLQTAFGKRVDELVPRELKKFSCPEELWPYLKVEMFSHQIKELVLDRFVELLPSYFEKNKSLRKAFEFYQISYNPPKILVTTVKERIAVEEDIKVIYDMLCNSQGLSYLEKELKPKFFELLAEMPKSTDWFLTCIKEKKFFGNEDLFYKKAKQFAEQS